MPSTHEKYMTDSSCVTLYNCRHRQVAFFSMNSLNLTV